LRRYSVLNVRNTNWCYAETTERIPMDRSPLELLRAVTLPPPAYFSIFPSKSSSHSVHGNVGSDNHVTSFGSGRRFGLVDIDQRQLEGNATVGREGEAWSVVIPVTQETSFRGLSIVRNTRLGLTNCNPSRKSSIFLELQRNFVILALKTFTAGPQRVFSAFGDG
jgi:hypothetical protein